MSFFVLTALAWTWSRLYISFTTSGFIQGYDRFFNRATLIGACLLHISLNLTFHSSQEISWSYREPLSTSQLFKSFIKKFRVELFHIPQLHCIMGGLFCVNLFKDNKDKIMVTKIILYHSTTCMKTRMRYRNYVQRGRCITRLSGRLQYQLCHFISHFNIMNRIIW